MCVDPQGALQGDSLSVKHFGVAVRQNFSGKTLNDLNVSVTGKLK